MQLADNTAEARRARFGSDRRNQKVGAAGFTGRQIVTPPTK